MFAQKSLISNSKSPLDYLCRVISAHTVDASSRRRRSRTQEEFFVRSAISHRGRPCKGLGPGHRTASKVSTDEIRIPLLELARRPTPAPDNTVTKPRREFLDTSFDALG